MTITHHDDHNTCHDDHNTCHGDHNMCHDDHNACHDDHNIYHGNHNTCHDDHNTCHDDHNGQVFESNVGNQYSIYCNHGNHRHTDNTYFCLTKSYAEGTLPREHVCPKAGPPSSEHTPGVRGWGTIRHTHQHTSNKS